MSGWGQRVRQLKGETVALYLACKDPRVPWYARLWVAIVVGYALSPIDLIPDFIPVLGHLDDLVLIPVGVVLAMKLIPAPVLADCRARAQAELAQNKPINRAAAVIVIAIWLALAVFTATFVVRFIE
ncbi:MAG: YkvA family protein [Chloroflexota bacterium]